MSKSVFLLAYICLVVPYAGTLSVVAQTPGGTAAAREQAVAAVPALTPQVCTAPAPINMTGAVLFGNGTAGSITQATLQALINTGGKIIFNGGSSPVTLTLNATLTVDGRKEVIIDGQGLLTISGNNSVRIFSKGTTSNQAEGTLFAVQNMRLINGRTNAGLGGAAIEGQQFGSLKVHNVAFQDNQGPLSSGDACGAVWTGSYKETSFVNCTFINNKAANGGAIGSIGSSVSIINCLFDNNQAVGVGGTFAQGGQGGAVYMDGVNLNGVNSYLTLCGSVFKNSTARHQAGALNASFYRNQGSTGTIDRCLFQNNKCIDNLGGAMYLQLSEGLDPTGANGNFMVTNCTFDNNSSPSQGGAAWVGPNCITRFANCTFNNNRALSGGNGLGGALIFSENTTNTVLNCTFAYNRAGNFASALFNGGQTSLQNTLFFKDITGFGQQANSYAGGVINKNSNLTSLGGNMQFPATINHQFGPEIDYWITSAPPGTVLTTDALLQNLASNGGPTPTMAIPTNSPAINTGISANAPATDQRGTTRTGRPDIGAFEFAAVVVVSAPVISASPSANTCSGQPVTLTAQGCSGTVNWSNGASGTSVQVNTAGTYTATCTQNGTTSPVSNSLLITIYTSQFSLKSGNWNDISVWSCGRVPLITEPVTISVGHLITLNVVGNAQTLTLAGRLTYVAGGRLMLGQ